MNKNVRDNIRWGFIGCGAVTESKSGPAYRQTEGFDVVAVMRRDLSLAQDYARRHGIARACDDASALIDADDIDAIYIATPPDSHYEYGLAVARAGKICCIEKPITSSYQQALELCEAFEQAGLPLFVAYYRRSLPRFQQVKSWLDQGRIGKVRHLDWVLRRPPNRFDVSGEPNWRTDPAVAPGGYFEDIGSHGLDLLCYLLGPVRQVSGMATNQQGRYHAKDALVGIWQHDYQGQAVTASGSWHFGCADYLDRVEIVGSEGRIEFAVLGEQPLILDNAAGRQQVCIDNPDPIQRYHVQAMRDCLQGGAVHPSDGRSAAHTTWVMEQIVQGRSGVYWPSE